MTAATAWADLAARRDTAGAGVAEVVEAGHAERVDEVVGPHEVHVAAHDAVDVLRREAGVGDRGQRRLASPASARCARSPG